MAAEGLRRYLRGSVPISIGLHLLALFLIFVIPLTANIVLPMVTVELPDFVRVAPMPLKSNVYPAGLGALAASVPAVRVSPFQVSAPSSAESWAWPVRV